jgi:hypothetical protein
VDVHTHGGPQGIYSPTATLPPGCGPGPLPQCACRKPRMNPFLAGIQPGSSASPVRRGRVSSMSTIWNDLPGSTTW